MPTPECRSHAERGSAPSEARQLIRCDELARSGRVEGAIASPRRVGFAANGPGWRASRRDGAAVTTKAAFSEDEWARIRRGPFIAGMAISLADPGGPIEAVKESTAVLKMVLEAG